MSSPRACSVAAYPVQLGDVDSLQRRKQTRNVILIFVLDYLRRSYRQTSDEESLIAIDPEVHRIVRMIHAGDRIVTVPLGAKEIKLTRTEFDYEGTFSGISVGASLAAKRDNL